VTAPTGGLNGGGTAAAVPPGFLTSQGLKND